MTTDPDQITISRKALEDALCGALAWGRAYGQVIPLRQWDEMRDTQIRQHLATLMNKPVAEITLTHRCVLPRFDGPVTAHTPWDCPHCKQAWKWNGTGWYKVTNQ